MKNDNSRQYRTVLITGGTRGIGKAAVYAFANANYRVAFCYKNSDKLAQEIIIDCQKKGQFVCGYKCDLADEKQVKELFVKTKKDFGFIDTIVNNAGVSQKKLFSDETMQSVKNCFANNFFSVVNIIKQYMPDMLSNQFGRIINISSVFASRGASCESIYSSTKGALESLTKSLALECASSNITVNAIAAGLVDTDMNKDLNNTDKQEFLKKTIIKAEIPPSTIADTILFLASDKANYLTGQIVNVNGGY